MKNLEIKITKSNNGLVSKEFAKNAQIFGTDEFNVWREFLKVYPNAKMVTEKNNNNSNRNLTYKNMKMYITNKKPELLEELDRVKKLSKIQRSPYNYVLNWFKEQFPEFEPNEENENNEIKNVA